ncbi:hypothetical protein ACFWF7_04265 [Nocardia sp. NPDC060256]|uniref:hypothetical protein n=1 Tax=unclassified Nocardia TaxID=2637762 RepID=UPI00366587B6
MGIKKIAAVATFTLAATGIAGTVAHAEPVASSAQPSSVQGAEHDVAFEVAKSADGKSLAATLFGGTFSMTEDAVQVTDRAGAVVASLPLTIELDQGTVELRPRIDAAGTRLTAEPIGYWRQTSPRQRSIEAGMAIGAFTGALTGAIVGLAIGIAGAGVLALLTFPAGFLAGALVGGAIGAGLGAAVPNSDVPDRWDYVDPKPMPTPPPPDSPPKHDPWNDCSSINHSINCR